MRLSWFFPALPLLLSAACTIIERPATSADAVEHSNDSNTRVEPNDPEYSAGPSRERRGARPTARHRHGARPEGVGTYPSDPRQPAAPNTEKPDSPRRPLPDRSKPQLEQQQDRSALERAPLHSLADGSSCSSGDECMSGICEGMGCGPRQGRCMPKERACTRDLRVYCGCDGQEFRASGRCPGRTFLHPGPCQVESDR